MSWPLLLLHGQARVSLLLHKPEALCLASFWIGQYETPSAAPDAKFLYERHWM